MPLAATSLLLLPLLSWRLALGLRRGCRALGTAVGLLLLSRLLLIGAILNLRRAILLHRLHISTCQAGEALVLGDLFIAWLGDGKLRDVARG